MITLHSAVQTKINESCRRFLPHQLPTEIDPARSLLGFYRFLPRNAIDGILIKYGISNHCYASTLDKKCKQTILEKVLDQSHTFKGSMLYAIVLSLTATLPIEAPYDQLTALRKAKWATAARQISTTIKRSSRAAGRVAKE